MARYAGGGSGIEANPAEGGGPHAEDQGSRALCPVVASTGCGPQGRFRRMAARAPFPRRPRVAGLKARPPSQAGLESGGTSAFSASPTDRRPARTGREGSGSAPPPSQRRIAGLQAGHKAYPGEGGTQLGKVYAPPPGHRRVTGVNAEPREQRLKRSASASGRRSKAEQKGSDMYAFA